MTRPTVTAAGRSSAAPVPRAASKPATAASPAAFSPESAFSAVAVAVAATVLSSAVPIEPPSWVTAFTTAAAPVSSALTSLVAAPTAGVIAQPRPSPIRISAGRNRVR
jgi:hypothetical protein